MGEIVKESCVTCGVEFGLSSDHKDCLKKTGKTYSCPNGHRQHYNKPVLELEALRTKHAYPADGQADAPRQPTSSLSFQPARPSGVGGAA